MTTKTKITLVSLIFLTGFISIFIYFVSGVSATYPPIKEYDYSGKTSELINKLQKYSVANPDLIFRITDTTGNKTNGYAIYMTIEIKNTEYSLKCEDGEPNSESQTTIKLVGVYDKSRNVGGYTKDAKGIDALVDRFEMDILAPLKTSMGVEIFPL